MSQIHDGILGLAVGDMLGTPVEFSSREELRMNPVIGPREGGPHVQPLGAWSDDTSLTLALADALSEPYELKNVAQKCIDWWQKKKYTSHDWVFDIGRQTRMALNDVLKILESQDYEALEYLCYEADERSNGNGSLMRILPLYFYLRDRGIEKNFKVIWQVSALTHPHVRSAVACYIYLVFIDEILKAKKQNIQHILPMAFRNMQGRVLKFLPEENIDIHEEEVFRRILKEDLFLLKEEDIKSSGYVVDTLEASIWCLLTTASYREAVLLAVNLGDDTDTTAAVTGGLVGILYGKDLIPSEWLDTVVRLDSITKLCDKLDQSLD